MKRGPDLTSVKKPPETPSVPLVRGASASLSWQLAHLTSDPMRRKLLGILLYDLGRMDRWLPHLNPPHPIPGRNKPWCEPIAPLAQRSSPPHVGRLR